MVQTSLNLPGNLFTKSSIILRNVQKMILNDYMGQVYMGRHRNFLEIQNVVLRLKSSVDLYNYNCSIG